MVRGRVVRSVERTRDELRASFAEDHTPREIAGSFAIGTFVTMLPTLGLGLVLFVALAYAFERVSAVALFASVLVFNPVVKWGVYVASFALGVVLLGPIGELDPSDPTVNDGTAILVRLLVGNLVLAAVASVLGYWIVHRLAVRYRNTDVGEHVDEAIDELVEDVL